LLGASSEEACFGLVRVCCGELENFAQRVL
jgi:hypothetical protein